MSNQQLFSAALDHMRTQGKPAVSSATDGPYGGPCRYQTHEGLKCAFGPAIAHYSDILEGNAASDLIEDYPEYLHDWASEADLMLANEIQSAHDDAASCSTEDEFMPEFEWRMQDVAEKWGLTY